MLYKPNQENRLKEWVDEAKRMNPFNVNWNDFHWKLADYKEKRVLESRRISIYFTKKRDDRKQAYVPFENNFADFAKAVIVMRVAQRGLIYGSPKNMIYALRWLYEELIKSGSSNPMDLKYKHFYNALLNAARKLKYHSAYDVGKNLQEAAVYLDEHYITTNLLNFRNPLKAPSSQDGTDELSQAEGMKKMPSAKILEHLAHASNNPVDDNERILLRIIDLLLVGGFRAGEVLTLPLDCWVEEKSYDKYGKPKFNPVTNEPIKNCGIRYWAEKGGEPIVKWLPDCSVPLAKRAVDDLTRLCADARKRATILEDNPYRVPITTKYKEDSLLTTKDLTEILGLSRTGFQRFLNKLQVYSVDIKKNQLLFRLSDIEKGLVKRRAPLVIVKRPDGKTQKLSESLCVMFCNQFNDRRPTIIHLVEIIGYQKLVAALGGANDSSSIFTRRQLTEDDGSPMKIKSHAFRHFINTLADQGGLSDVELALWMGRRNISQNAAYKHGTVKQRMEWAHQALKDGKLFGDLNEVYQNLNGLAEKEAFLESFVGTVHFTPYGVCLHDFAIEPCKYHLNCLSGCSEYLRTKGDAVERQNLLYLREFTINQLNEVENAAKRNEYGANNWVEHNRRILAGCDAALAVDNDVESETEKIKVFASSKSKFQDLID